MSSNKARELETLKQQLDEREEELKTTKAKLTSVVARRDTLEKQVKDIKAQFQSKMQILIEKAENDDKLIAMLKAEVKKIE